MWSWVGVWGLSAGEGMCVKGCVWGVFQQSQRWWVQGTEPEESHQWCQASGWRDPDCVSQLRAAVGLKEVHGLTHHSQSPPKISSSEKFTVLRVNSGMKQNTTASMHSFDSHCNLRICAVMAFLGLLFALHLSGKFCACRADFLLVWARSELRKHMLLAVLSLAVHLYLLCLISIYCIILIHNVKRTETCFTLNSVVIEV